MEQTGNGFPDMRQCETLSGMKNEQNFQTKATHVPEKKKWCNYTLH